MSIFLSLKHNQTILLFITPKKFHVLSKIAYVIMCIYILVQRNTILAIHFFSFYNKCSSKSPLSLLHVIYLQLLFSHLFGSRCSQAGFAVEAKLQKFQGPMLLKTGQQNPSYALLWLHYLPENRGWGFCFWNNNNKNTKYSLFCSGESQNFKCAVAFTLTELAGTVSQQCFYQMLWSDTPGKVSHCWSQSHCQSLL